MSDRQSPPRRRTTAVIVGLLVLVIAAVVVIALLGRGGATPAATTNAPQAAGTQEPSVTTPAESTSASPVPQSTATPHVVVPTGSPTPQPTRTATIAKSVPVPIVKQLSATVVKMESVTGTADGPGEIAGPSVRFTIRITNTTGAAFSLSDAVINAYYGASSTPALQLQKPGGKDFPASVANGGSATGVFVFNIPKASRSKVEVTVDTSVRNPVIAFKGAAP